MLLRVKDLIKALADEDLNAIVFIASDPKRNTFSTIAKGFRRSLLKIDKRYDKFAMKELQDLKDNTETVTIYPVY